MNRIVTEDMLNRARMNPAESGMTREERRAVFADRELEQVAMKARYPNGRSVKEVVDEGLAQGRALSFARLDKLGREYYKMAQRRQEG